MTDTQDTQDDSPDKPDEVQRQHAVDVSDIKNQIRDEILAELKDEKHRELEQRRAQRVKEAKEREQYVDLMKVSNEPWVDIVGWADDERGIRVELDWNDAFVLQLKDSGIKGVDDDQIVQQWITLLLRDMADKMDDQKGSDSKYA